MTVTCDVTTDHAFPSLIFDWTEWDEDEFFSFSIGEHSSWVPTTIVRSEPWAKSGFSMQVTIGMHESYWPHWVVAMRES